MDANATVPATPVSNGATGNVPAKSPATAKPSPAKNGGRSKPSLAETNAALLARIEALESAKSAVRETGYRVWSTKPVDRAMYQFARWIADEFPEFAIDVDPKTGRVSERFERLVTVASKAYRPFQGSAYNRPDGTVLPAKPVARKR